MNMINAPMRAVRHGCHSDQDGQVAVIRTRSRTVVAKVPVGRLPLLVAVNPKTNTIYASNQEDATVSVISGTTDTVTKMISVGFDPQGVAVNPRTNRIYVANLSGNTVSVISGRTNRVTATTMGIRPDRSPGGSLSRRSASAQTMAADPESAVVIRGPPRMTE